MSIKFENVSFSGNSSPLKNTISKCCASTNDHVFKDLNGVFRDNSMIALMGPSGAGKTTLLKCLSDGNRLTGFAGNLSVTNSDIVRAVFITQSEKEHLLMRLTVKESLVYASKLKNTFNVGRIANHRIIADNLLSKLELEKCANNSVNKCSGGQCKRLAIGLELTSVRKPKFLLLDEPTSGLDSSSGFKVIHLLKSLSQSERMSIIVTIHQPSYKILELFDSIYALTNAGNCIYYGEPSIIKQYLTGFGNDCPDLHNPADLLIDVASNDTREERTEQSVEIAETRIKSFFSRCLNCFCCCVPKARGYRTINSDYDQSDEDESLSLSLNNPFAERYGSEFTEYSCLNAMKESAKRTIMNEMIDSDATSGYGRIDNGLCVYKTPFRFRSLWFLLMRTIKNSIWREKQFILFRFALHAIIALILSILYSHKMGREDGCFSLIPSQDFHNCSCVDSRTALKDEDMTSQNAKFHFFSLLFLMFAALMPTVLTFPDEVKVFINEHRNGIKKKFSNKFDVQLFSHYLLITMLGWYSTGSYYLAKTLAEIPIQLLFPFLYTWFLFYITGQIGMDQFDYGVPGLWRSRFTYFILFTELTAFITQGMAFLIGIIFVKSFNITIFVSSSALLLLFLFSGFFVKVSHMGSAQFLTYFSYVRFSFESLMITIYGLGRCDHHNLNLNLLNTESTLMSPLIRYGSQSNMTSFILYKFDLNDSDLWKRNFSMLLLHLVVWRLLAYCALRCRVDHKFLRPNFIRPFLRSLVNYFTTVCPFLKCLGIKLSNILFFIIKFMIILVLIFICILSIILLIALIVYLLHL